LKSYVPKIFVKNENVNYIENDFVKGQDLEKELCETEDLKE